MRSVSCIAEVHTRGDLDHQLKGYRCHVDVFMCVRVIRKGCITERAMKPNSSWTLFFSLGFAEPFQDKEKALSKRKCMYIP